MPDPDFLYAVQETTACAAFITESRMNFANAMNLDGNPGKAKANCNPSPGFLLKTS
jgi:hypothetical protein